MRLWHKWDYDTNETMTKMRLRQRLWHKWDYDTNETMTQMRLWQKWD